MFCFLPWVKGFQEILQEPSKKWKVKQYNLDRYMHMAHMGMGQIGYPNDWMANTTTRLKSVVHQVFIFDSNPSR